MKTLVDGTKLTPMDFIQDILVQEMGMDDERVNIYNQVWKMPSFDGLFILIDNKGARKTIASRNAQELIGGVYTEVQMVNTEEVIAISVMSRNQEAELRKEEVLMAINSIYSQQVQEENSFKIARLSAIENLSSLEGAAMLTRYEISLIVFAWTYKAKTADFYDSFNGQVKTEQITRNFVQNVA